MTGPWEDFQPHAEEAGPWADFQAQAQEAGPWADFTPHISVGERGPAQRPPGATVWPDLFGAAAPTGGHRFPDTTNESVVRDIVTKAVPGGLARGAIGSLGAPADTNEINKAWSSKIADVLGVSPETQSKFGAAYDFAARTGLLGALPSLGTISPTSDTIKRAVEDKIGPLPEARTVPGQYVQTGAEFLPALIGNRGSLLRGLATNVAIPALASETAGQLTKGTEAEPYVRMLAAILGGMAGAKLAGGSPNARAVRTPPHASRPEAIEPVADVVPPSTAELPPPIREPLGTDQPTVRERPDGPPSGPTAPPRPSSNSEHGGESGQAPAVEASSVRDMAFYDAPRLDAPFPQYANEYPPVGSPTLARKPDRKPIQGVSGSYLEPNSPAQRMVDAGPAYWAKKLSLQRRRRSRQTGSR